MSTEIELHAQPQPLADSRPGAGCLTIRELARRVNLVHQVMRQAMKEGVHYGVIPGCRKPSLWQPGADLLAAVFGLAIEYDVIAEGYTAAGDYEVMVRATARNSDGRPLGAHYGRCSTAEDRFAWQRVASDEEWEQTPRDQRRERTRTYRGEVLQVRQVRVPVADRVHTALMMAQKRAKVGLVREVTAASDIFTDSLEDLPILLDEDQDGVEDQAATPATRTRPSRSRAAASGGRRQPRSAARSPAAPTPPAANDEPPTQPPAAGNDGPGGVQEMRAMRVGDRLACCLQVVGVQEKQGKRGPYCVFDLTDDTHVAISAYRWAPRDDSIRAGSWIDCEVEARDYQGQITYQLREVRLAEPGAAG